MNTKRRSSRFCGVAMVGPLLACVCATACHKEPPAKAKVEPIDTSPVPAPANVVVDVVARGPDALWGKLRQGVSGPLTALPQSIGGALATVAKLDLTLAGEVDGASPAYGVIDRPAKTYGWVVALRLRDLDHARMALLEGKAPHFSGRKLESGLTVLGPPPGPKPATEVEAPRFVSALSPLGYLLVARSELDLVDLAAYATRTLPARPQSPHALVVSAAHAAFAGFFKDQLVGLFAQVAGSAEMSQSILVKQHGGKSADLGDPRAAVAWFNETSQAMLPIAGDVDHGELTADPGDDDVTAELVLTPGTGASAKAFETLKTGDAAPLLTLSSDTEGALLFQDDPAMFASHATSMETHIDDILKPLSPPDTKAVHDAFSTWADSRGPWLTLGFELDETSSPALTMRTLTQDPDQAMRSVADFIDLSHVAPLRTMLESHFAVQSVSTATVSAPGSGATSIATFHAQTKSKTPADVAVAWAATGGLLHVAAGASSARALRSSKEPAHLLGTDVAFAGKLGTLRDRVAVVFAGRPHLDIKGNDPRPSVVIGLGHDKANGWGALLVDDALIREGITRWFSR